jgi:beta-aspartyl-peptidase (threonine type)
MKHILFILVLFNQMIAMAQKNNGNFAIVIHGGAGNLVKKNYSKEELVQYEKTLSSALDSGYAMLQNGQTATQVVEKTIQILEDSPLFNAGKGSVFSNEGRNEMDAAIMDGSTLKCGAVTNLQHIKNPISLAKHIMENSSFVFLNGEGAEKYAKENGFDFVEPEYFFVEKKWNEMLRIRDSSKTQLDNENRGDIREIDQDNKYGTVGCVVLDQYGNLSAGTSTGGITNKKYNRIGDSPLIGAGTYANNETCAISCTGHGEDFIRLVVGHQVHSLMKYNHRSIQKAADLVIQKELTELKGRGGLIAIDKQGNIAFSFNTTGMFRGYINKKGEKYIGILK